MTSTAEPSWAPPLDPSDVHVWSCRLTDSDGDEAPFVSLLDAQEQQRAARFQFPLHRRRYLLSHMLLRRVLATYLRVEPQAVQFDRGPQGKPMLRMPDGTSSTLHFSLSHSEEYVAIAVARGWAVGVDVECGRADVDGPTLAARFFAPGEARRIATAEGAAQRRVFYRYWTAKEAYLKGRGVGIAAGLHEFEVLFAAQSDRAQIQMVASGAIERDWSLELWDLDERAIGALAVQGGEWVTRRFDAGRFLR